MQRFRQLRYIVVDRLVNDFGYDPSKIGFLVTGASFGGAVAQYLPLLYPDEFHGGVNSAFPPNLRTVWNDHDSYDFFTSNLGRLASGFTPAPWDFMDFSIYCRTEATDYTSLSLTNRVALNRELGGGHILRPLFFLAGDVDTVTHANDWVQHLDPSLQSPNNLRSGKVQMQGMFQADVYWSVVGKSCHGDGAFGEPVYIHPHTAGTCQGSQCHELREAVYLMVDKARDQIDISIAERPPKVVPKANTLATLDPHDHVLARNAVRQVPGSTKPGLLTESTSFQRLGNGLWLGWNESLVVRNQSIWTGSADGVITRFVRQIETPGVLEPLVAAARSQDALGGDYSLGYGVWALAVGEVDGSNPGEELVAAGYRRIAVFKADTLELVRSQDAPFGSPHDAFVDSWPERISIADIESANAGNEIIFHTRQGKIIVMNGQLQQLGWHGEAGVRELLVGPNPGVLTPGTSFTKPVYAMTARGHLARLELNSNDPSNMGRLAALSELQHGEGWDLEVVQWGSPAETKVLGLFRNSFTQGETPISGTEATALRMFDPSDLSLDASFGSIDDPDGSGNYVVGNAISRGLEPAVAVASDATGNPLLVVLHGHHLAVWDSSESLVGLKYLETYAPAVKATAVEAGDLDGLPGDEIVVSTLAGHVVWFSLAELQTPGTDLGLTRTMQLSGTTLYQHRTNTTLAGTWPLALKTDASGTALELHAIDQTGTWWTVDPATGVPTFVDEVGLPNAVVPTGLAYGGAGTENLVAPAQGGAPGTPTDWFTARVPGTTDQYALSTVAYTLTQPATGMWGLTQRLPTSFLDSGFWLHYSTGGVWSPQPSPATWPCAPTTGEAHAAWWVSTLGYPNHVQAAQYSLTPGTPATASIQAVWNSTGPDVGGGAHPPAPEYPGDGISLRTELRAGVYSQQSCKIGTVHPVRTAPQVVVSGTDGVVMILDSQPGAVTSDAILTQSADFGYGGMALALSDLDSDGNDEILFAPYYDQVDGQGNSPGASLRVLDHDGTSLQILDEAALGYGGAAPDFPGYAASGIAVWDLDGDGNEEILVTTLNGEIVAFTWDPLDGPEPTPLGQFPVYHHMTEGSVGGFNSIVVADLLPAGAPDGDVEVYIAGSMGLRRFDTQSAP
ncbi:MAG: hypothetical protein AAF628_15715 [Planctomycetota bacterium]